MKAWRRSVRCVGGLALLLVGFRERGHRMLALVLEPAPPMQEIFIPAHHWWVVAKNKWLCGGGMN